MVQAHYRTVFEIGPGSFPWGGLLQPVGFVVLGLLLLYFGKNKAGYYKVFGIILAAFAALLFLIATVTYVPKFVESRRAYKNGDSLVVEGVVENFHPPPQFGGQKESFSVSGIVFSYYVGDTTPCFHNDAGLKGPIRSGIALRIYYKDGCIQRIDVNGDFHR